MQWGLDGARGGWILARMDSGASAGAEVMFCRELTEVVEQTRTDCVAVDMPIGLASSENPVRAWDARARKILTGRLSSRVFSPPIGEVLTCKDYSEANALQKSLCGRGISVQAWNITPKIRALAQLLDLRPELKMLWLETHPEIAFARLNGGLPIVESKKSEEGFERRRHLLKDRARISFHDLWDKILPQRAGGQFVRDDVLDALALAVIPLENYET